MTLAIRVSIRNNTCYYKADAELINSFSWLQIFKFIKILNIIPYCFTFQTLTRYLGHGEGD